MLFLNSTSNFYILIIVPTSHLHDNANSISAVGIAAVPGVNCALILYFLET